MADLLDALLRANLTAGLAILVVAAARIPARRLLGARLAYGLWALPPLVFIASLLPRPAASAAEADLPGGLAAAAPDLAQAVWLAGALACFAALALSQWRFLRAARAGRAGPAMVGVVAPRFVTPADYAERYAPEERALIRAHERAHVDRHDPRVNALIALAQCVNWFNPLVHLAAGLARLDQELACDATVMARHPGSRRAYARAMLKAGMAGTPLPLGCRWLAHPLEARIGMLKAPAPAERRVELAGWALAALALAAAYGAWLAQPQPPPRQYWQPPRSMLIHLAPETITIVLPERS